MVAQAQCLSPHAHLCAPFRRHHEKLSLKAHRFDAVCADAETDYLVSPSAERKVLPQLSVDRQDDEYIMWEVTQKPQSKDMARRRRRATALPII